MKTKKSNANRKRVIVVDRDHVAPVVVGAVAKGAQIIGKIPAIKKILGKIDNLYRTDNVLIRNRDNILALFRKYGITDAAINPAMTANKLSHKEIPDRKLGKTYDPEWERLHQFVLDVLVNAGKVDAAEVFASTVPIFDSENHDWSILERLLQGKAINSEAQKQAIIAAAQAPIEQAKQEAQKPQSLPYETALGSVYPAIQKGLSAAGYIPTGVLDLDALTFYENIVLPNSGNNFTNDCDHLDPAIEAAIIGYLAKVTQLQNEGAELNKVNSAIASTVNKVTEKIESNVRERVNTGIGSFITENPLLVAGGIGVLILVTVLIMKKR